MKARFLLSAMFALTISYNFAKAENKCESDEKTLCSGVEIGKGRILKCLASNKEKLSPGCKEQLTQLKNRMMNLKESCSEDAKKLCDGVQRGRGAMVKCLKEHQDQLSESCKTGLSQMKNLRKGER